jgi:tetratricopeptide (TPR) repeat protein
MAPERFEAKEGNERSDIYSLGVSLYEIVTDDLPFPGPNFAEQHLRVTIPSPMERKPDLNIDPALNAIIMKCLEKNPADRYANADEMLADIRRLQRGETVGGAKKEDEIRKLFDGAQEAAAAENWDRVIELSEKVLRLDPQNESARSGIKYAREAQDKIEREIAQLIQQADDAQKNGNYQSAKQLWTTVLEKRPQNKRAQDGLQKAEEGLRNSAGKDKDEWIRKAKAAQQDKNYQIAIDFWQRVLRADPNHIEAKASLKAAEQALRDQRDKVARISALARAEEEKENFERANQLWQDVLDADPNHDVAKSSIKINNDFIRQGEEERRRKAEDQARANRAIQLAQMEVQRWAERAQQYERNGDNQNALQAWQKVLELDPNHSQAQQRIRELTAPQRHKKIEYAVAAASVFIDHLHRPGFDRGMIATFGNTFKIEQGFTDDPRYLQQSLLNTARSVTDERTCLYDSIEQSILQFWQYADRRRPWVLTIITDGQDNESRRYPPTDRYSASRIGEYVRTKFNHEPTNFPFLIAIGDSKTIDANALAIIGQQGGFPAVTLAAFPLLEEIFMRIAVQVSSELVGQQFNYAGMTWQTVQEIRRRSAVAIDYAFLIDRSGSMNDLV